MSVQFSELLSILTGPERPFMTRTEESDLYLDELKCRSEIGFFQLFHRSESRCLQPNEAKLIYWEGKIREWEAKLDIIYQKREADKLARQTFWETH